MRRTAALIAAPLAVLAVAPGATAASGISIHVSPKTVVHGKTVRVYGAVPGCPAGDDLTLLSTAFVHTHDFAGVPAVYASVNTKGAFSVKTKIPATKAPGHYVITGRCGGGNIGVTATLHVVA